MTEPEIWTFFYGSYINTDVLAEVDQNVKLRIEKSALASVSTKD